LCTKTSQAATKFGKILYFSLKDKDKSTDYLGNYTVKERDKGLCTQIRLHIWRKLSTKKHLTCRATLPPEKLIEKLLNIQIKLKDLIRKLDFYYEFAQVYDCACDQYHPF
jgi:hypothetical protein